MGQPGDDVGIDMRRSLVARGDQDREFPLGRLPARDPIEADWAVHLLGRKAQSQLIAGVYFLRNGMSAKRENERGDKQKEGQSSHRCTPLHESLKDRRRDQGPQLGMPFEEARNVGKVLLALARPGCGVLAGPHLSLEQVGKVRDG